MEHIFHIILKTQSLQVFRYYVATSMQFTKCFHIEKLKLPEANIHNRSSFLKKYNKYYDAVL